MELEGIVALVTGGGSGLGEATARRLSANGVRVLVVDRSARRGEKVAADIGCEFARTDVTVAEQVEEAVAAATRLGPLRLVVNCAGGGPPPRPMLSPDGAVHDLDAWQTTLDLNLTGTFNVTRLAAAEMAQTQADGQGLRGLFVNTSSIAAFEGAAELLAYSTAKAALAGFTISAARAYAPFGIRVMTIAPGTFLTPALVALGETVPMVLEPGNLAPRRHGAPDEFAFLVEHIARNDFLNAETIRIDGGVRGGTRDG